MRIDFIGQAYQNRSIPVSSQRCINWYPELELPGSRDVITLQAVSGITLFQNLPDGAIRGLYFHEQLSLLFAVSGLSLYQITQSGVATRLGLVDGSGLVAIAGNTSQIALATGVSAYIYDSDEGLTKQTDLGAVKDVIYQNEFFIFVNSEGQQFKITGLSDGRVFDPLDFASAQSNPDPLIGITKANSRVWMMGSDSYELWSNVVSPTFPIAPINGANFDGYGLAGTFGKVIADSKPYWVSNDGRIYRGEGYSPLRISHYGVENSLRTYSTLEDVEASAWTENGHRFIAFSFPSGGETWVFDSTSEMWHQRSSGVNGGVWRARFAVKAWGGKRLVGDRETGNIGELDLDIFTEYGNTMMVRRTGPVIHADQKEVFIDRFELVFESGRAGQNEDPKARLSWSDNGGVTFGNPLWRSLGKVGEYNAKQVWTELGQAQNRVFDLQITDDTRRNLISCVAEGEAGEV